ncbi:hypothetical protein CAP48_18850 [Advenella sp. S44]|nr:hypothetical protein CAP48_18850 [Advenella sp. S44]
MVKTGTEMKDNNKAMGKSGRDALRRWMADQFAFGQCHSYCCGDSMQWLPTGPDHCCNPLS